MIKLSTYVKILKLWITLFSYWVIKILVDSYPRKNIDGYFYFYVYCLFYGMFWGLVAGGIMEWFDLHIPFESNELKTLDFVEPKDFNSLNITKQPEVEELKTEENPRKDVYLWLAVTITVYCIVFATFY